MISIIIPCYNEEEIIEDIISELELNISKINQKFEIIFIDNKSVDLTENKIKSNIKKFENCKIIKLSNYVGNESAILAGIDNSNGSACIIMDPDLEDPPSLINEMIDEWKNGFDVVYAVRKTIKTTFIKKIMRHSFYLIYSYLVNKNFLIPKNTGDFRLIDKNNNST